MATELIRCPVCGGLLAYREDSEFKWKSCWACGRQFGEQPLSRVKNASGYADPDGRRGNGSVGRLTRSPRRRKTRMIGPWTSVSLPPICVPSDYELEFDWPITLPALPDDDEDDDGDDDDGESLALVA